MEKVIYVHIARLGDSLNREKGISSGCYDATNDWYVIKQTRKGRKDRAKMSKVFEDAGQSNHPDLALVGTDCVVLGSLLYVIGGRCFSCQSCERYCEHSISPTIRCLDVRSPKNGWRTCFTLPYTTLSVSCSAVVDNHWCYIFPFEEHWCYGFNFDDGKYVPKLPKPSNCTSPPSFSVCLSPGTFVAYKRRENVLYQLNRKDMAWSVYHQDFLPYAFVDLCTASFAIDDDGILYILLCSLHRLVSFDIRNKKEISSVDIPRSFWFGLEDFLEFLILSKNNFCLVWDRLASKDMNKRRIFYTRFTVSFDAFPDPILDIEETRSFLVAGCRVINIVAVDPSADIDTTDGVGVAGDMGKA